MGAVGCDLSMFTHHIIAAISVMIQAFIHGEITKQGPQIDDDLSTCVTLAQHIIATIVMAILSADQQTHGEDFSIHGGYVTSTIHGMGAVSRDLS